MKNTIYLLGGGIAISIAFLNLMLVIIGMLFGIIYSFREFFVAYDFICSVLYIFLFYILYVMLNQRYQFQAINIFLYFHMFFWFLMAFFTIASLLIPETMNYYIYILLRLFRNLNKVFFCLIILFQLKYCSNIFLKPFAVIWLFAGLFHLFLVGATLAGIRAPIFTMMGHFMGFITDLILGITLIYSTKVENEKLEFV
jgi:hypothetical protein